MLSENHQNKYNDNTCRWCQGVDETDEHVLRKCRKNRLANGDFKGLFGDRDLGEWKNLAELIQRVIERSTYKVCMAKKV